MIWRSALIALAVACLMSASAEASPARWIATWGASPEPPLAGGVGTLPASPSFTDQTVRQIVRISAGGKTLRVRLTNQFGVEPLVIGAAHIGLAGAEGAVLPGSDRVLTFDGKPQAVIPPGAPLLSDPVDLDAPALSRLAVSLYLPGPTGPCTCHGQGLATAFVGSGDQTAAESFPTSSSTPPSRAFLAGIEASAGRRGKAIIVLGDSISDGVGSSLDQDHRWPDLLADRLDARKYGSWGVVNEGIGGNRLLHDGIGASALARFDRDVLAQPGARFVIVFEGINDIGLPHLPSAALGVSDETMRKLVGPPVTAEDMIGAYRQLIARAHSLGLKIFGATLTPYEGAAYSSPDGEVVRQAVNAWIRTGGAFDAVIDFDKVWRDPAEPTKIRSDYHVGDHLHGNDAGYKALADSIDLSMFK